MSTPALRDDRAMAEWREFQMGLVIVFVYLFETGQKAVARWLHTAQYDMRTGCPLDAACDDTTRLWVYDKQHPLILLLVSSGCLLLLALALASLGGAAYGVAWLWRHGGDKLRLSRVDAAREALVLL